MKKINKMLKRLRWLFPAPLPTSGMQAFDKFAEEIIDLYGLPDLPTYKQTIATMIMHHPQHKHRMVPYKLAGAIKKAMANQIAYEIIQKIRQDEADKLKQERESAKVIEIEPTKPE